MALEPFIDWIETIEEEEYCLQKKIWWQGFYYDTHSPDIEILFIELNLRKKKVANSLLL